MNLDSNHRDPISATPGAQPAGVGVIVGGAPTGAATRPVPPPVETATEATVGVIVGGSPVADGMAEAVDPSREIEHWREHYGECAYVEPGSSFDDYGPAYGFGASALARYPGRRFEDVETEMSRDWTASRGASRLSWGRARPAARDAWNRLGGSA